MCQVIISFSKAEKKPDSVNFLLATEIGRYDRSVRILFNHIISLLWVMRPTTCLLAASTWRTWGELETSQTSNRRLPPSMRARVRSSPLSRFLDGGTDAVGRFVGLRPKLHESFDARSARLSLSVLRCLFVQSAHSPLRSLAPPLARVRNDVKTDTVNPGCRNRGFVQ